MAELSRQRRARDLAITPGHLRAAAVVVVGLVLAAFGAGWAFARGDSPTAPGQVVGSIGDQGLVELLARVDARAVAGDGMDSLTFPDTLTGVAADPPVPVSAPDPVPEFEIAKGAGASRAFDLVVVVPSDQAESALRAAESQGWKAALRREEGGATLLIVDAGAGLDVARRALERWNAENSTEPEPRPAELRPR